MYLKKYIDVVSKIQKTRINIKGGEYEIFTRRK